MKDQLFPVSIQPMAHFDHIIVGAGAAGCVMTRRLIDAGRRVLLIEAGALKRHCSNVDSVGGFTNLWGSAHDWALKTTPQPGLSGREITINQGKLVGGSSAINAMMYVRCHSGDYRLLAERGGELWSLPRIETAFSRLENYVDGPAPGRYASGLMTVRNCPDPRSYSRPFQTAAKELGYAGDDWDYNGPVQAGGAGPLQFNIGFEGKRHSAFNAYLEPILSSPLLSISSSTPVSRLAYGSHGRVSGVTVIDSAGHEHTHHCDGDVILSAGALLTPQILLRSGIGPAAALSAAGLKVHQDIQAVGQNLMDHLQLPVIYRLTKPLPEPEILTGNVLFLDLNGNSPYGAPDLQLNFTPASPQPLQQFLPPLGGPVMIFLPILVQPRSVGSIRILADGQIVIDPQYLSDWADVTVFEKAIDVIRGLTSTRAMTEFAADELAPGGADTEGYIRSGASTLWHPVGTCSMGDDDHTSVVDGHLRVHGVKGLRIADASVTPHATAGNNHVPTMVVAENAASLMLEGH
jgi:choline dehydrogenase